jgi:hypothetical protein
MDGIDVPEDPADLDLEAFGGLESTAADDLDAVVREALVAVDEELSELDGLEEMVQTEVAEIDDDPTDPVVQTPVTDPGSPAIADSDEVLREQLAKVDVESDPIADPAEILRETTSPPDEPDPEE